MSDPIVVVIPTPQTVVVANAPPTNSVTSIGPASILTSVPQPIQVLILPDSIDDGGASSF